MNVILGSNVQLLKGIYHTAVGEKFGSEFTLTLKCLVREIHESAGHPSHY